MVFKFSWLGKVRNDKNQVKKKIGYFFYDLHQKLVIFFLKTNQEGYSGMQKRFHFKNGI